MDENEPLKIVINKLLVDVFNDILAIEEITLKNGVFNDLTITEVHTIEAVGLYEQQMMGEIAKKLKITVGTLTVAINNLVKKGYAERFRNENDRRVVEVGLTKKGKLMYRAHQHFHHMMVKEAVAGLNEEESRILAGALTKIHEYLNQVHCVLAGVGHGVI